MLVVKLEDGTDPHDPDAYWVAEGDGALHRHWGWLERVAAGAAVTPLSAFLSVTAFDVEGYVDDDHMPADLPPARWSAPADGLAAVRGLASAVRMAEAAPERERLVAEFAALEAALAVAARGAVRFRLSVLH